MPFSHTNSRPTPIVLIGLFVGSLAVVVMGVWTDYSFMPNRGLDAFLYQIEYAHSLLIESNWTAIQQDPLALVHILRYAVVWPFLEAERLFGPAGGLSMILVLLWPLLILFRPQRGDWRDLAFMGARFAILFLPLLVSGRTVLVAAGMGYLVSSLMIRPFSGWRMAAGCSAAVLSSVSVLFSIAVIVVAGNWRDRSTRSYAAKGFFLLLLIGLLIPSLFSKAEGFSAGAAGYAIEGIAINENRVDDSTAVSIADDGISMDRLGTGPQAAVYRIFLRSTVVQSYINKNIFRFAVYLALFAAAWAYVAWSIFVRHWHPILIVLAVLSSGIFLEGLALWPILFPLVWAYTGIVRTDRNLQASNG